MSRRRTLAIAATSAGAAALIGLSAMPATQATSIFAWQAQGTVTRVADGDTFLARIPGENAKTDVRVRMAGIQSMERGECLALAAQNRLARLIKPGTPVIVRSAKKSSVVPNGDGVIRPLRYAFKPTARGDLDLQLVLLRSGLVLPDPIGDETAYDLPYSAAAQRAAARGVGHWNPLACGAGPIQDAQLRLMVNYNADGNDALFPERRFARVVNDGTTTVDISGWHLRTAKHKYFYFPAGTVIAPGGAVVVRGQDLAGVLTSGNGTFYWRGSDFPNPDTSKYDAGGAYLFDPDGDIRAWTMYPCQVSCASRWTNLGGKVTIEVNPTDRANDVWESVEVANTSTAPVDLGYYVVDISTMASYEFPKGTVIDPGQSVHIYTTRTGVTHTLLRGTSPDDRTYLGKEFAQKVVLRSHESTVMACVIGFTTPCPA